MNKEFWERIDRLEELAKTIKEGEWVYESENENIRHNGVRIGVIIPELGDYIAAANPALILEMIAELRRLEKADKDKHKIILEDDKRIENAEVKALQLEKEADWLAEKARKCSFAYRNRSCHHLCVGNCSICLYENRIVTAQDFRELARKAISEADNA